MSAKKYESKYFTNEEIDEVLHVSNVRLNGKIFAIFEDTDNECYRFFHTDEEAAAWKEEYDLAKSEGRAMDTTIAAYEFPGNYIPGSPNYSTTITPIHGDGEKAPEGSTGNYISFRPMIMDRSKNDTGENMDIYVTITNSTLKKTIYVIAKSNTLVTVDIDDYVKFGDNEIVIKASGRANGAPKTIAMTYSIFRLSLESTFDISTALEKETNFSVKYRLQGNGQKKVYFYIDGVLYDTATYSASETDVSPEQGFLNTSGRYAPGKHTLQIYAESNNYPSELHYYEFMIKGLEETFTTVLVQAVFPSGTTPFTGSTPGFTGTQFVKQSLVWAYYTNDRGEYTDSAGDKHSIRSPKITWRLYSASGVETHIATRTADIVQADTDQMPDPIEFMPDGYGKYRIQAIIDGYDYRQSDYHKSTDDGGSDDHTDPLGTIGCYSIQVEENENVQEYTEGLVLKYSGLGRSNEEPEATRKSLSYTGINGTIAAEFSTGFPFNSRYGYNDDAICIGGGYTLSIPCNPLKDFNTRKVGNTFEIDYETFEVKTLETPVAIVGKTGEYHIAIYPTKAVMQTNLGTNVSVRIREAERHKVAFVTYADDSVTSGTSIRMLQLFVDGKRTQVVQYGTTDNMQSTISNITIGDSTAQAGIKLYVLRIFKGVVPFYRLLDHFIIDSGANIETVYKRNNIYVTGSHRDFDVDKLKNILPVWEWVGPMDRLYEPSQDKTAFTASGKYTDVNNPDDYMEGSTFEIKPSGESSLTDNMMKGFHVKFDKQGNQLYDADGNKIDGNRWTPFEGNVPEKKIRLNADGLESSHTHNSCFQNIINDVFPKVQVNGEYVLRTPIQSYVLEQYPQDMADTWGGSASDYTFPYAVNYASTWKPVVCVWQPDTATPQALLGIFSMGEEKKSDFAHGRRSVYLNRPLDDKSLDPYNFKITDKKRKELGILGARGFNNDGIIQVETVRDDALSLMTSVATFNAEKEKTFEKIYPDSDDQTVTESNADWQKYHDDVLKPMAACFKKNTVVDGIPYVVGDQDKYHTLLFSGTFNIWSYLAARIIVRRLGLTDTYNRNKEELRLPKTYGATNTEWQWWFAYWDLDMALGLQQPSGALVIEPGVDRTSVVGNAMVFTSKRIGDNVDSSLFWDLFDEELRLGKDRLDSATTTEEIAAARVENLHYMFLQLDNALSDAGFTASTVVETITEMAEQYGEALYNADGQSKYLDPWGRGIDYLLRLQGDRLTHMSWWVYESFERADAENGTGQYQKNAVAFRLTGNSPTAHIKFKVGAHSYFGFGATTTMFKSCVEMNAGETAYWEIGRSLNANDPLQIYVPQKIEEFDASEFGQNISGNVELAAFYNSDSKSMLLRKLNLGVPLTTMQGGTFNVNSNKTWSIPTVGLNLVEEYNLQGWRYISSTGEVPGLSLMTSLSKLYMKGATGLVSLTPPSGTTLEDYQLPDSVQSMVLSGNTIQSLTFWHDEKVSDTEYTFSEVTGVPTSLAYLQMSGMGSDTGAHTLFKQWLSMVYAQEDRSSYRIIYNSMEDVTEVPIEHILMLCAMYKANEKNVILSGYIKCSTTYTEAQMNTIMEAFGDDSFEPTADLIFDCDSDEVLVSASGDAGCVTVKKETDPQDASKTITVVEVLQGASAQLTAVGFPIVSDNVTYQWYAGAEYTTGSEQSPLISLSQYTSLHYTSGSVTTQEHSTSTEETRLLVQRRNTQTGVTQSGSVILRVVPRSYPTKADIQYTSGTGTVVQTDEQITISGSGHYIFDALHTPDGYTGNMTDENGGVWTCNGLEGLDCASRCDSDYSEGHDANNRFCLSIAGTMPDNDTSLTLSYKSNWKGGVSLTAATVFAISLVKTIARLLENNVVGGNPALFAAIKQYGIAPSLTDAFSSLDLRKILPNSTIAFADLLTAAGVDVATLTGLYSGSYYIPNFLKNVVYFDFSDCTGLKGDVDITNVTWIEQLDLSNTATRNVTGLSAKPSLASLNLHAPTIITISDCPKLTFTNIAGCSTTEPLSTEESDDE